MAIWLANPIRAAAPTTDELGKVFLGVAWMSGTPDQDAEFHIQSERSVRFALETNIRAESAHVGDTLVL